MSPRYFPGFIEVFLSSLLSYTMNVCVCDTFGVLFAPFACRSMAAAAPATAGLDLTSRSLSLSLILSVAVVSCRCLYADVAVTCRLTISGLPVALRGAYQSLSMSTTRSLPPSLCLCLIIMWAVYDRAMTLWQPAPHPHMDEAQLLQEAEFRLRMEAELRARIEEEVQKRVQEQVRILISLPLYPLQAPRLHVMLTWRSWLRSRRRSSKS